MIEAFYIVLLVVFASLTALSLVDYLVRQNSLKEQLGILLDQLGDLEQKLGMARAELENLEFDIDLLEEEQQALQAQASCMQQLEEAQAHTAEEPRRN